MEETISTALTLVVKKEVAGELDTNIGDIENFVTERIKEYTPDKFEGNADEAKKKRAELNKGKKQLGDTRQAVIDRLMQPYRDFEARCKNLESMIDDASGKLDAIVKSKEAEEKEAKRALVQTEWSTRNFDLVPFEVILERNPKWLNKTCKMTDISKEMGAIIKKIHADLETIENNSDDAETLKAHYLMCLDLGETLSYGEELRKNRELAEQEAAQRPEREHRERLAEQQKEIQQESKDNQGRAKMSSLVSEALEMEVEATVSEYTFSVSVTASQLTGIKNYLTMQGIEYECNELIF